MTGRPSIVQGRTRESMRTHLRIATCYNLLMREARQTIARRWRLTLPQFDVLAEFLRSGKVKHVGLSEVDVDDIEEARKYVPIVSVQNRYNVQDREWDDVVDYCEREGIAFIPWYPLNAGKFKRKKISTPEAIAWLLQRSPIMLPIPGTSKVKHLEENMQAAEIIASSAKT